jgi:hypothetical protein
MGNHSFGDVLYSWGPMLLLIIAFLFVMLRGQARRSSQNLGDISLEQLEEVRHLNRTLERIAAALDRDRDRHPIRQTTQ